MNNNIDKTLRKIIDEQKPLEIPQLITDTIDDTLSTLESKKISEQKLTLTLPYWMKNSISVAVCLILLIGSLYFIIPSNEGNFAKVNGVNQNKLIKNELEKAPYQNELKVITYLPFEIKDVHSIVRKVPGSNETQTEITYSDKNKEGFVTLNIVDAKVENVSEQYDLIILELNNGLKGTYLDNESVQILSWQDGSLAYKIIAAKDIKDQDFKYTKEEMLKIANSLK